MKQNIKRKDHKITTERAKSDFAQMEEREEEDDDDDDEGKEEGEASLKRLPAPKRTLESIEDAIAVLLCCSWRCYIMASSSSVCGF